MRTDKWMKGFGIGIILLFLGASVLPNVTAHMTKGYISDENINNQITQNTFVTYKKSFIGLILMREAWSNYCFFNCIFVYYRFFQDGELIEEKVLGGKAPIELDFNSKNGYAGRFIICATFTL